MLSFKYPTSRERIWELGQRNTAIFDPRKLVKVVFFEADSCLLRSEEQTRPDPTGTRRENARENL